MLFRSRQYLYLRPINENAMTLHREGTPTILLVTTLVVLINTGVCYATANTLVMGLTLFITTGFWLFILSFFRIPSRVHTIQEGAVIAPADGEVVVIEEVQADEYFTDRRIQVSIFMSPLNVHVNRNPVSGYIFDCSFSRKGIPIFASNK